MTTSDDSAISCFVDGQSSVSVDKVNGDASIATNAEGFSSIAGDVD